MEAYGCSVTAMPAPFGDRQGHHRSAGGRRRCAHAVFARGHCLLVGAGPGQDPAREHGPWAPRAFLQPDPVHPGPDAEDIVGSEILDADRQFLVRAKGPIFANIVLARRDQPYAPKTQAALLRRCRSGR